MNNFDIDKRTIYLTRHGSHAYGTNVPSSDLDLKGICIEPREYHFGYLHRFEQHERMANKGNEHDLVVYSLKKFAKLAADCNPNIIEVLFADESDIITIDEFGEELRDNRNLFLSRKARHTFSGYAHAQLKRIKTHRQWLLNPPKQPPERVDFGLSDTTKVSKSELGAFENALEKGTEVELAPEAYALFMKEREYVRAKTRWEQYQNWIKTRNPARAELEAKHGYDTKHGMHLIRLMRMCSEILSEGKVIVKRPDRDELLAIRDGQRSYDNLIEEAEALDARCGVLYETSPLPHSPDRAAIDALIVNMTNDYINSYG